MNKLTSINSICLFQTYWTGELPLYIKYYLLRLADHEKNIIFITNKKIIKQDDESYIKKFCNEIVLMNNEGFDFGMYYKYLVKLDIQKFDRLTLINDSVILFKRLDNIYNFECLSKFDFVGLTDSHSINYHLQSYFLIFNKKAIKHVKNYFLQTGIKTTYYDVVINYEVGLTQYLIGMKLKPLAIYKGINGNRLNPIYYHLSELIVNDFPFIKKKLITQKFGFRDYLVFFKNDFNLNPFFYMDLIVKYKHDNHYLDENYIKSNIINHKIIWWRNILLILYKGLSECCGKSKY
jgi:lipopolysaccharide biosynthesis protein